MQKYFAELARRVKVEYSIAEEARKRGLDPKSNVEIPLATTLAERAMGLISVKYPQIKNEKLAKRIAELEKEYGKLDPAICLKIGEEIVQQKFCKFKNFEEAFDAGIRLAFAYYTLGVVVPPLEGFTHYEIKKTREGKDFICAYFSGPIRAAGTTAGAFVVLIIDYLRQRFGYARYDPTEKEIKRNITEIYDFHERITNLQYLASEDELKFLLKHLPIQIDGLHSEDKEVSNYKDLERVETNFLRNGICLVLSECLAQKAPKLLRILNKLREQGFPIKDWDFLEEYVERKKKADEKKKRESATATYIKDLVAGRPVLAHPSRSGAFRLRYGRTRDNGFSAMAIHPATMAITNNFLAMGTQIKVEKPTKGAALGACDSIDGPIIKLRNGSVKKIASKEEAALLYKDVEEIIYLGDILVPYADFLNRNYKLEKPGYVEQWWNVELKKSGGKVEDFYNISFNEAVSLSEKYKIPLHPRHIYFWSQIEYKAFQALLEWLAGSVIRAEKLIFPFNPTEKEKFQEGKRALEILGVEHETSIENVVLAQETTKAFLFNLGIEFEGGSLSDKIKKYSEKVSQTHQTHQSPVLDIINKFSKFKIRDKAGTFIGARMGRPEKAKLRKLTGSPHVLFPVGNEGGRLRSVQEACSLGSVKSDFPIYHCRKCDKETIYFVCENCDEECDEVHYCPECDRKFISEKCPQHGTSQKFYRQKIDIQHYLNTAAKSMNLQRREMPPLIKGVRGTSSKNHTPENLAKGILRAMFNLNVNKEGTIRYDATELPITHFKPKEIGTTIDKLKGLGYYKDKDGKELVSEDQILELKPHDVLLPACPESGDEGADEVFMNITRFIDNMLVRLYKMQPFYNVKNREDLVGHLVVCIAPHNAAGVIGRIIGFSKVQAMFASPYMHAGVRRDCDGDESAFILLLDALINFSREYLPAHRGATQDAPLVLNMKLDPGEVDDQIFDFDLMWELPLEFYEAAEQKRHPSEIVGMMDLIRKRVDNNLSAFTNLGYDYETSDINAGVLCSSYKKLVTMQEKVQKQMELVEKIRAVDNADVARLVIQRHLIRDIRGNLRKFSQQQFRCVKCNEKYRRPPLAGSCLKCGGRIIFTVSEGGIVKYLEPAIQLASKYNVSEYVRQSLHLTKLYIESIFGRETEKQEALQKWF